MSGSLLSNSASIFLVRLLPMLSSLVGLVLFARYMPPGFYGRYQNFWVQWQVLSTLACMGLPALVFTYPGSQVTALLQQVRPGAPLIFVLMQMLLAACFAGLASLYGPAAFQPVLAGCFLLCTVAVTLAEAYLMVQRSFHIPAILSAVYAILFIGAHWLVVRNVLPPGPLLGVLTGASAVRAGLLLLQSFRHVSAAGQTEAVNTPGIRQLWLHLAAYDMVQMLFRWIDKLVLGLLLAAPAFALYFNGTIDIPFLPLLLGAAGSALLIQFNTGTAGDAARIRLIRESGALLSRIVFPVFCFLVLFRQELFGVVFRHRYDAAVTLFLLSSLVLPLRAYNFTSLLQHKGKGRIINTGAVLDLVLALALMYPLYLLWGLNGIALSFVISTWLQAGFYLFHTARLLRVRLLALLPLRAWALQLIAFSFVFIALYYALHRLSNEQTVLFLGAGALALVIALSLLPVLWSKRATEPYGPEV